MNRTENYEGHPGITGDIFKSPSELLELFLREEVTVRVDVLDPVANKVWIEIKGIKSQRAAKFEFSNNNPSLGNFKNCLIQELTEIGMAVID